MRFGLIAFMYTAGVALIFDVGTSYVLPYFVFKILIEAFGVINMVDELRSILVLCVYLGFFYIIKGFKKVKTE